MTEGGIDGTDGWYRLMSEGGRDGTDGWYRLMSEGGRDGTDGWYILIRKTPVGKVWSTKLPQVLKWQR